MSATWIGKAKAGKDKFGSSSRMHCSLRLGSMNDPVIWSTRREWRSGGISPRSYIIFLHSTNCLPDLETLQPPKSTAIQWLHARLSLPATIFGMQLQRGEEKVSNDGIWDGDGLKQTISVIRMIS